MPVKAIPKVSISRNGVGAYVLPCHRISVQYCNHGGSSSGIRDLLASGSLNSMASAKSKIYFDITKQKGHPNLVFHYNNDHTNQVSIANLPASEIMNKINEHSQATGNKLFKWNHKVLSINESVRGIWSPLHTAKENRHKI
ncbi:uncharacterized protein AC631_04064 [Debaryomyces fabryi]|uniref:Large ribosomal subunit protein mL43 n=1 Tax=Debaryomyces fabryi TaxID=58627 RepID=A0A0V1PVB0_9ASCO|nr:uncharacterized protein AC631_04064 [Debaryomyces fabryi]KSA00184.1 hypothetical protein AC631_04064 [Debaryomyces fabryi]CUM52144.1 unnamed protein product [Debaryomyces fabryi]